MKLRGFTHAKRGFTLIELLVAVGIMAVVTGIGLTRIGDFGAEKRVAEEANKLAADLRWSRTAAQNGLHAGDCTSGVYGGIKVDVSTNSYTMTVQCAGGGGRNWTKNFSSGVTASGTGNVIFEPVDQGIDGDQSFILNKDGANYYSVSVGGEGAIKIEKL